MYPLARIYTDVDSLLPVHVRVITARCKPFNQQETGELCQAREAFALAAYSYRFHNFFCCKQGDGYIQQNNKCANEVKQEDCDSECKKICSIYTNRKTGDYYSALEGYWELVEPLKQVERHSGHSVNLGWDGKPHSFSGRAGSTIFVSFKGSRTGRDWTANFNVQVVKFTTVEWNLAGQQPHLYAHKGFVQFYGAMRHSIFDHVERMMKERPATDIHLSGHSLGGAMANLCAVDFAAKYPDVKVALWTFGAPRVFRGAADIGYFPHGQDSARNGVCACVCVRGCLSE